MSHVQELVCLRSNIHTLLEVLPHWAAGPQRERAAVALKLQQIMFTCSKLRKPGRYCYFQGMATVHFRLVPAHRTTSVLETRRLQCRHQ